MIIYEYQMYRKSILKSDKKIPATGFFLSVKELHAVMFNISVYL